MNRFAYSIFCDDIRHEVNGKLSLIGTYDTQLLIPKFPATVSKLCVIVTVVTSPNEPFSDAYVSGKLGDQELFKLHVDRNQLAAAEAEKSMNQNETIRKLQTMAILSPISFDAPGDITIEVSADGRTIECSGLEVRELPKDAPFFLG